MDLRPVPAFYCCYLLRSTVRHASLYIGSTPNPKRRLAQHNGLAKGGAFRTSRTSLRPWEMICIVTGFPSSIAALQFEWTWQNPHITRHIRAEERITVRDTVQRMSKSGKRKKAPRPQMSLRDRLANLHLLLRVPSFARWPLKVRFFSNDVFQTWEAYLDTTKDLLGDEIEIVFDAQPFRTTTDGQTICNPSIEALDVTYDRFKPHLEKSNFLLAEGEEVSCSVCQKSIDTTKHMALVCSHEGCRSASHLSCLSEKFLAEEQSQALIPRNGKCPTCRNQLQWSELVTELTLRTRGQKEIAHIMRNRRARKPKVITASQSDMDIEDPAEAIYEERLERFEAETLANKTSILGLADEFVDLDDFDEDDASSVTSIESVASTGSQRRSKQAGEPAHKTTRELPIVIEDSEYDSAEAID